jgi:uncharacterized protein YndB with AHSA1/START domain
VVVDTGAVDVVALLDAPHPAERVWPVVSDLSTYPRWLDIVPRADLDADGSWTVDLRGRLGPFARTKRLRMVRTAADEPRLAVFERAELDGRNHSRWVLRAEVEPLDEGATRLTMRLHYGGSLFGPVLERLLGDTIERSRPRLLRVLDGA